MAIQPGTVIATSLKQMKIRGFLSFFLILAAPVARAEVGYIHYEPAQAEAPPPAIVTAPIIVSDVNGVHILYPGMQAGTAANPQQQQQPSAMAPQIGGEPGIAVMTPPAQAPAQVPQQVAPPPQEQPARQQAQQPQTLVCNCQCPGSAASEEPATAGDEGALDEGQT